MAQPSAPTSLGRRGLFFLNLFLFSDVQLRSRSRDDSVSKQHAHYRFSFSYPDGCKWTADCETADGRRQTAASRTAPAGQVGC
ncbi:hypothetical protein IWZ03DRAFT_376216 [Phyllosticta citriasiana]|uniref:Secreted protein n=1 Tax=Phyllosticta citriasiana TaxID=595635 RepID=A0ABR1KNH9_9PEZI